MRIAALLALLFFCVQSVHAATASVDRTRLAEGETLELRIRIDGTGATQPELQPLDRDFEVVSSSRNSRISLINGHGESFTEWAIALAPRHAGELEIAAIEVGSEHTLPIRVTVTPGNGAAAAPGTAEVAVEVVADAKEIRVQQQLLLTVRLLHAVDLDNGATLDEPAIAGAVVRKLGEGSYEKRIEGRRYGVFERRYAIFPQASGELVVPQLLFAGSTGAGSWLDRFGGAGRRLRLRSQEQHIRVLPPEPGATPWLPARLVTLVETWDRSPQELRVGESATRTLTVTANALTGAQLPALPAAPIEGLRSYPDKPEVSDETADDGVTGTRIERSAVIALRAGEMQLPEVRLRWWDTVNSRFDEAVVPGRTIRVQPAAGSTAPLVQSGPAPAAATTAGSPQAATQAATVPAPVPGLLRWQIACALLGALALVSTALWWRSARRPAAPAAPRPAAPLRDEAAHFEALEAACACNDSVTATARLLEWSGTMLPPPAPRALAELPVRLGEPALASELHALAASRYASTPGTWDGAALRAHLQRIRAALLAHRARRRGAPLPPLYPDAAGEPPLSR